MAVFNSLVFLNTVYLTDFEDNGGDILGGAWLYRRRARR